MKAFAGLLTVCLLASLVAGCATPAAPTAQVVKETVVVKETQLVNETVVVKETQQVNVVVTATPTTQPAATAVPLTAAEEWAKANGLGPYQPATEDWAAVEAAAKEEGSVCVYCNSSKIAKIVDAWNALYPDIKFDCGDTDDIAVKMQAEQEAGNVIGDVWYNSDGHILYGLFVPKQWIWSYVPPGVVEPELTAEQPFAVARHSIDVWGYNNEVDAACPFTNWWELTEPKFMGKIFIEDPMTDVSTMAKWATIAEHGDEMAAAYQELYGKDWTTDPDAVADPFTGEAPANAGWLFIKKLAQNKPVAEPGGDEVDAAYATLGMDPSVEPGVGWTGWDSVEATADGEIAMAPCLDVKPVFGIEKTTYLGIANYAPHPNAAKLFIKFALTPEGMDPWIKVGIYSAQPSVPVPEGALPFEEMTAHSWLMNPVYDWEWAAKVRDFWAISLLTPKSED
jgi:iron(III) transport system substrate-binding protein